MPIRLPPRRPSASVLAARAAVSLVVGLGEALVIAVGVAGVAALLTAAVHAVAGGA